MYYEFLIAFSIVLAGCQTKVNSRYCDETTPCAEGQACDLVARECAPADLAMTAIADLGETGDISTPDDLSPLPDLQEPDLQPEPDLAPYPDLLPPPPYFSPDVQNIINTVGCAKSSCHDINAALYVPYLIPSPAPGAPTHANYTSFSAEPELTVIQKLVNNNGVSHGGVTKNSADRKPCASDTTEPCATLSKWYTAGMLENAP